MKNAARTVNHDDRAFVSGVSQIPAKVSAAAAAVEGQNLQLAQGLSGVAAKLRSDVSKLPTGRPFAQLAFQLTEVLAAAMPNGQVPVAQVAMKKKMGIAPGM